jgi:hypothetical protein
MSLEKKPLYANTYTYSIGADDVEMTFLLRRTRWRLTSPQISSQPALVPEGINLEEVVTIYMPKQDAKDFARKLLDSINKETGSV